MKLVLRTGVWGVGSLYKVDFCSCAYWNNRKNNTCPFHFHFIIESKLEIEISNLSSARRWAKGERGYYGLKKKRSSLALAFKNVSQLVVLLWVLKKKLNHCGLTMP